MGDSFKKEQHEKAYGEGVREARESDALSQMAHNLNPFGPSTTTEKSHEAGWRDYWEGKTKSPSDTEKKARPRHRKSNRCTSSRKASYDDRNSNTEGARTGGSLRSVYHGPRTAGVSGSSTNASGDVGGFVFVTLAVLVVGGVIAFFIKLNVEIPARERAMFQSSGSVPGRRVNANELYLRSGPGLNYSIVRVFHRGDVVVVIGGVQNADGIQWINVTTADRAASGWLSAKFLSP
jgi:hypothetical protein